MRKLAILFCSLSIIISIALCTSVSVKPAKANSEYLRIITEDTPFYSDPAGTNLLFNLPYTYYVRVLERGELLSHVECYGSGGVVAIDGYVPTLMLFEDGLPVQSPYLNKEITTLSTAVLYSDKNLTAPLQYIFSSRALKYYGQITALDGSVLFYVGYNNKLGYVEESAVLPFEVPLHPNELTFIQPEIPVEDEEESNGDTTSSSLENVETLRIIVIVCLILAGLVALFIALKNKPKKQYAGSYYDENEYE